MFGCVNTITLGMSGPTTSMMDGRFNCPMPIKLGMLTCSKSIILGKLIAGSNMITDGKWTGEMPNGDKSMQGNWNGGNVIFGSGNDGMFTLIVGNTKAGRFGISNDVGMISGCGAFTLSRSKGV